MKIEIQVLCEKNRKAKRYPNRSLRKRKKISLKGLEVKFHLSAPFCAPGQSVVREGLCDDNGQDSQNTQK